MNKSDCSRSPGNQAAANIDAVLPAEKQLIVPKLEPIELPEHDQAAASIDEIETITISSDESNSDLDTDDEDDQTESDLDSGH